MMAAPFTTVTYGRMLFAWVEVKHVVGRLAYLLAILDLSSCHCAQRGCHWTTRTILCML